MEQVKRIKQSSKENNIPLLISVLCIAKIAEVMKRESVQFVEWTMLKMKTTNLMDITIRKIGMNF